MSNIREKILKAINEETSLNSYAQKVVNELPIEDSDIANKIFDKILDDTIEEILNDI